VKPNYSNDIVAAILNLMEKAVAEQKEKERVPKAELQR
jgi:hypothetical protein